MMHDILLADGGGWGFLIFFGIVIISAAFDALKKSNEKKNKTKTQRSSPSPRTAPMDHRQSLSRDSGHPSSAQLGGAQPGSRPQPASQSPAQVLRRLMEELNESANPSPPPEPPRPAQPTAAMREAAERAERLKNLEEMARERRAIQDSRKRTATKRPTQQEMQDQRRQRPGDGGLPPRPAPIKLTLDQRPTGVAASIDFSTLHAARLREALVLNEILQPPLAMRGRPGGHRPRC